MCSRAEMEMVKDREVSNDKKRRAGWNAQQIPVWCMSSVGHFWSSGTRPEGPGQPRLSRSC